MRRECAVPDRAHVLARAASGGGGCSISQPSSRCGARPAGVAEAASRTRVRPANTASRQLRVAVLGLEAARGRRLLGMRAVSYTHLRAHETPEHLVCRLLL